MSDGNLMLSTNYSSLLTELQRFPPSALVARTRRASTRALRDRLRSIPARLLLQRVPHQGRLRSEPVRSGVVVRCLYCCSSWSPCQNRAGCRICSCKRGTWQFGTLITHAENRAGALLDRYCEQTDIE